MNVRYLRFFLRDLERFKDKKTKQQVKAHIQKIKAAQQLSEITQLKKLKGHPCAYRIRIGNYRMGVFIENDCVTFARFVKRNDIYKLFP